MARVQAIQGGTLVIFRLTYVKKIECLVINSNNIRRVHENNCCTVHKVCGTRLRKYRQFSYWLDILSLGLSQSQVYWVPQTTSSVTTRTNL